MTGFLSNGSQRFTYFEATGWGIEPLAWWFGGGDPSDINMPWIYPQPPGKCQWLNDALKGSPTAIPDEGAKRTQ